MIDDKESRRQSLWDSFDPNNPHVQILLLSQRVDTLGKEKEMLERKLEAEAKYREELEERVEKMETSFQRGAGILMILPIIGGLVGLILAYGKVIFAPWTGKP